MADIRLLCFNCLLYNGESDALYEEASEVRAIAWDELRRSRKDFEALERDMNTLDETLFLGTKEEERLLDTLRADNERKTVT